VSKEKKVVKVTKEDGTTSTYEEVAVDSNPEDNSSTHIMTDKDEDLRIKAERAGTAVSDLVDSTIEKASQIVKGKYEELAKSGALEPGYASIKKDSSEIGRLGSARVTQLVTSFEEVMTLVAARPYEDQERMLTGFRKLLEEQINVIDSRIDFAKRVRR
jgi:hypothetical protein